MLSVTYSLPAAQTQGIATGFGAYGELPVRQDVRDVVQVSKDDPQGIPNIDLRGQPVHLLQTKPEVTATWCKNEEAFFIPACCLRFGGANTVLVSLLSKHPVTGLEHAESGACGLEIDRYTHFGLFI